MRFQPVICNMMQLTRKRIKKIHASYTLEGTDLENVESIKYLGVTITSDLRWNTHVSNVCTKANRTLGFLRKNLYYFAIYLWQRSSNEHWRSINCDDSTCILSHHMQLTVKSPAKKGLTILYRIEIQVFLVKIHCFFPFCTSRPSAMLFTSVYIMT